MAIELKLNGLCVCGHDPTEDPNEDCERCQLVWKILGLQEDARDDVAKIVSLRAALAASESRAKRLEDACAAALPVIANAIVHGMPVTKGVAAARNLLAAALAGPAADAGGGGFLALAEWSCTCGSVRCIPCRIRDFYREIGVEVDAGGGADG